MPEGTIFEDNPIPEQKNIPVEPIPAENTQPEVTRSIPQQNYVPPTPTQVAPPPPPIPQDHSGGLPVKKILLIIFGILLFILGVVLVIALISSRSGNDENKQTVVSYWGVSDDSEIMKSIIADFEKENPNIKVEYGKQDLSTYREKLSTRFENGTGPDIFSFHNSWYPMLSKNFAAIPEEIISKNEFRSSNPEIVSKDLIVDNNLIGVPLGFDTLILYVNPQILKTAGEEQGKTFVAPKTWEEFIGVSRDITKRNDRSEIEIAGAGIGTFDNVEHASDIISLLFAQNGVDFNNLSQSANKIDDALEFYTNFARVENNVWDNTLDNTLQAFAQGKLAMFFGYASDYRKIKDINPSLNFEVYPVPQLLNAEQVNLASYWAEGVSDSSANKEAAYKFIQYLNRPEVQEKIYQEQTQKNNFPIPYSNKKSAAKLKDSMFAPVISQSETAVSSPFISGTFDNGLNSKLTELLGSVINKILTNQSVVPSEEISGGYDLILGEISGNLTPEQN